MGRINFYFEGVPRLVLYQDRLREIIQEVGIEENISVGDINIVFCTDNYLLKINNSFLDHDYYTDIVTFDYTLGNRISGELYISVDRVKENAVIFQQPFKVELVRVILHGVLHLLGYCDTTSDEELIMRNKEDYYLSLFQVYKMY